MATNSSGSSQEAVSLRTRLEEHGALSLEEASIVIDKLAEILDGAAKRGLMHGVLSPENVLFLPEGEVRLRDEPLPAAPLPANVVGSGYLSPEEARHEPPTPATDIWALGSLLYEMLTGKPPFSTTHRPTLARQVQNQEPEPLPEPLACAQQVIECAMAKWPTNRYHSAQALANAFWECLPHPPSDKARLRRPVGHHAHPPDVERSLRKLGDAADRSLRLGPKEQRPERLKHFLKRLFPDGRSS